MLPNDLHKQRGHNPRMFLQVAKPRPCFLCLVNCWAFCLKLITQMCYILTNVCFLVTNDL